MMSINHQSNVGYMRTDEPVQICSVRFNARLFAKMKLLARDSNVSFNKFINDELERVLGEVKNIKGE